MRSDHRWGLLLLAGPALAGLLAVAGPGADAQGRPSETDVAVVPDTVRGFTVDGRMALSALMSLGDGHLQRMADGLSLLATTDAGRSGDWERIRIPLAELGRRNVPAVLWFALPDGTYWTLEHGREETRLSDRAYFPHVLAGETVIGDLVVSRSTRFNTAIVAVPVRGPDDHVVGVLGSSVELDSLTARLRNEMGGLPADVIFFAIDAEPLGALNSDPSLIFAEPMKLGDEGMRAAFREILAGQEGVVNYDFRGSHRTVFYRKSAVTGWWYGLGTLRP